MASSSQYRPGATPHHDTRGLPISTASAKAAAAFDHLVTATTYRADTPARLDAVLEADPTLRCALHEGLFRDLALSRLPFRAPSRRRTGSRSPPRYAARA
jgi:hypothetical protein